MTNIFDEIDVDKIMDMLISKRKGPCVVASCELSCKCRRCVIYCKHCDYVTPCEIQAGF